MDISLLRLNFILFHDELFYICRAKQTVARFLVTGIIGRTCDYRYPGTDRASESDAAHLARESNRGTAATDLSAHVAKIEFLHLFPLFGVTRRIGIRTVGAGDRRRTGQLSHRDRRGLGARVPCHGNGRGGFRRRRSV